MSDKTLVKISMEDGKVERYVRADYKGLDPEFWTENGQLRPDRFPRLQLRSLVSGPIIYAPMGLGDRILVYGWMLVGLLLLVGGVGAASEGGAFSALFGGLMLMLEYAVFFHRHR